MSSSLQEQLLKAGLITEDQVKKSRQDNRRAGKAKPQVAKKNRAQGAGKTPDERTQSLRRELEARREQDRKLNLQREAQKAVREAKQRARQFARKVCLNSSEADLPFHFVRGDAVKRLYVTEDQRARLVAGELAIVAPAETHFIVSREHADGVRALFGDSFLFIADDDTVVDRTDTGDDPYAQYEVPDDLTW